MSCIDDMHGRDVLDHEALQGYWVSLDNRIFIHYDESVPTYYRYLSFVGDEFGMYDEVFFTCDGRTYFCPSERWMTYVGTKMYKGTIQPLGFGSGNISDKKMVNVYFQKLNYQMEPVTDNQIVGTIVLIEQYGDTLKVGYSSTYSGYNATDRYLKISSADFLKKLSSWRVY